ncbi:saccharopine dehydrogenase NADP-binding domain-containing protein [Streptomyces sp. NBC_01216]|uniref:saccharopine dehydrogenase NADP-binding domain-containing protein n=1 Tax=Streptomyces sp. NBC_01216 TaxID=2903778 RepID=UPI002E0E5E5A|nr:saccharopine dehydrogenase NADP-binding domain-containing protein [Streptomyces sp. NBC_01216]
MTGAPPLIGVLGGYGAVGGAAARVLADSGFRLRIGGRDPGAAARCAAALPGSAEGRAVDALDDGALARFAHGCDVLLNCAGPAYLLAGRPRRAAAGAGARYVDVMDGSEDGAAPAGERTAVLSAGIAPGLSGLLPRLLTEWRPGTAGRATRIVPGAARFTGLYVSLGAFTRTGATDYLLSMDRGYGTPRAQWRDGRVVPGALRGAEEHTVAGVPHPVTAHPYLTRELVAQARALGLAEARWYNAFDGRHLLDALNRSRACGDRAGSLDAQAEAVVRASTLDALGRTPYHVLWGVLESLEPAGSARAPVRRTVLIRGDDGSAMTGVVGAVAAREVAFGRIGAGVHRAASVLRAGPVTDALRRYLPGTVVTVCEDAPAKEAVGGRPASGGMEEGVL